MALAAPQPQGRLAAFAEGKAGGESAGKTPSSKGVRVRTLGEDPRAFKAMLYGRGGTGKTYAMVPLLLDGLKIFVLTTDIGGDGLATVEAELRYMGRTDLLRNVREVTL